MQKIQSNCRNSATPPNSVTNQQLVLWSLKMKEISKIKLRDVKAYHEYFQPAGG